MSPGNVANIGNIKLMKFCSVFAFVTWRFRSTKRRICVTFFVKLTQTFTQSMYITADCCLQRDRVIVMLNVLRYSTFTVQILYKPYSLQLNCTYSNYTEAAATCSAVQQEWNCQAAVFYCGMRPAVWNCESHITKLDPSKKFRGLKSRCHNLTALYSFTLVSCSATARWPI